MMYFLGTSHAANTLREAARRRGLRLTDEISNASLIFVSEDTPTDNEGKRDLEPIIDLIEHAKEYRVPVVVTSQVPPGFMATYARGCYHQAETLRIEDAIQRGMHPEMFIVGCETENESLRIPYRKYLESFDCPIFIGTYEDAEFTKIAINMTLISQIENTNRLSMVAAKVGADWGIVSRALRHDSRIGKFSYLTPGDWSKSKHLLRDYMTVTEIEKWMD